MLKRLTIDLPEETHRRLKVYCANEGIDMVEVVRKLIEEYLQKAEKKNTKKQA